MQNIAQHPARHMDQCPLPQSNDHRQAFQRGPDRAPAYQLHVLNRASRGALVRAMAIAHGYNHLLRRSLHN